MRSRWDFHFETTGIRFDREHKYAAKVTAEHAHEFDFPAEEFDALITIHPDEKSHNPLAEQTGMLKITIPGGREQTKNLAFWLADKAVQQIAFSQGEMKIHYGLILGELLPDTPEEADQLGDKPFFAEAHLIEALPTPTFDGSALGKVSSHPLIDQFNAAKKSENPIDKFLGLFRIIEDLYGPTSKSVTLADALKSSNELFQLVQRHVEMTQNDVTSIMTENDFNQLVARLVKTRHQCAHLKRSKGFGITHGDPRVRDEIEPLAELVRLLAFDAIQMRL